MMEHAKGERNQQLIVKLVLIAIASVVVTAVIQVVLSVTEISSVNDKLVMEELRAASKQLNRATSSLNDEGDWEMVDGVLMKGGGIIEEEIEFMIDRLKEETDIDYTIFYGDTRRLTTIYKEGTQTKLVGTKASDAVIKDVLKGGLDWSSKKLTIEGMPYYGFYSPLKNSDGSVVGMVFAGRHSEDIHKAINVIVMKMIFVSIVILVVVGVLGYYVANKLSTMMKGIATELNRLSEGTLNIEVPGEVYARKDELGIIAESSKGLSEKLSGVINKTKTMAGELSNSGTSLAHSAEQATSASSQVTDAVEEISKGATAQAESVENAAQDVQNIGNDIDTIAEKVKDMEGYSKEMKNACDSAMDTLANLVRQSSEVQVSVKEIGNTIHSTNESARSISEFSSAIANIASQTNMLSLNASIEAARAGEAGRGFAVVAQEIGTLAAQSSESAEEIKKIVERLLRDSAASVEVMSRLNESFSKQEEQMDATKATMQKMSGNVEHVSGSADVIADKVNLLMNAKDRLVEIIADLSAISEENAASAEETNASMEELNATFSIISEAASKLQKLANDLTETISYFS